MPEHDESRQQAMTVRQAGQRGGEAVRAKYGAEFFAAIGQKGGSARKQSLGSQGYAELGRMGGQARKAQLGDNGYAELGRRGGQSVSRNREYMAEIGRRGGLKRRAGAAAEAVVQEPASG